ncbi:MAG: SRPBCC family protein [Bacteroidota bacterium]|nr:SRPBCC family protein [Bacteroidota bacterium]
MTTKIKVLGIALIATLFSSKTISAKEKDPIVIKQELIIDANIDKAWQVLGPQFADAYKWASSIKHSEARDHNSFNGSSCTERGCNVKGMGDIKEKLLIYSEANHQISYQVYEGMPKMVKYASNTWTLTDLGNGKTKVEINLEMKTGGMMGSMMGGMMKKKMTKMASGVIAEFKYYVETGMPHPNKIAASK